MCAVVDADVVKSEASGSGGQGISGLQKQVGIGSVSSVIHQVLLPLNL